VSVFRFPSNTKKCKKWEVSIYQILIHQKRNDLFAIAIVNKNPVNRTVPFDNELVPLNGPITSEEKLRVELTDADGEELDS